MAGPIVPATRSDKIQHFALILKLLEASQAIAVHRRYVIQSCSSVASQLPTMNCFYLLLRFSWLRWHIELFYLESCVLYHMIAYGILITMLKTV